MQKEKQDDNAGENGKMFFLCSCIFCPGKEDAGEGSADLAGAGCKKMGEWKMWDAFHAKGDNTSWAEMSKTSEKL